MSSEKRKIKDVEEHDPAVDNEVAIQAKKRKKNKDNIAVNGSLDSQEKLPNGNDENENKVLVKDASQEVNVASIKVEGDEPEINAKQTGKKRKRKKKRKKNKKNVAISGSLDSQEKLPNGNDENENKVLVKDESQEVNVASIKVEGDESEINTEQTGKKKKKNKKIVISGSLDSQEKLPNGNDDNDNKVLVKDESQEMNVTSIKVEDGEPEINTEQAGKKKKKNKNVAISGSLDSQEKLPNGNDENENKVLVKDESQEVNVASIKVEGDEPEISSNQTGNKKRKKKKKRKSKAAVGGSGALMCNISEGEPFSSLEGLVSEKTMKAIAAMGFTNMTAIQSKSIPPLLEGKDVRGTAKTGSGKTLAFVIPTVERLHKLKFTKAQGTGVIIISPTRELSMQTFSVLLRVIKTHSLTSGIIMGGVDQGEEAKLLAGGINVLVCTPGRLLHHLQNTPEFVFKNLVSLVIDEADRILDVGFEEEMNKILELLPKTKQTMFFSATRDKKVNLLARLSLNEEPLELEDGTSAKNATVDGLEQGYVVCPTEKKFLILHNFLENNKKKKIMVFFNTCNGVKFYHGLLTTIGIKVLHIHGKQKQEKRTSTYYEFCKSESAILLCTDVAARGWDIPAVDWIVQYDPPEEPKEYIHRVGRTARAGGNGKALLFILEKEQGLLKYLKDRKVHVKCENISWNKMIDLQLRVEKTVKNNSGLKVLATLALMSYLRAALDSRHQDIYDIKTLDLNKVAKCLGFETLPSLPKKLQSELKEVLPEKPKKIPKRKPSKMEKGTGNGFAQFKRFLANNQFQKNKYSDKSSFLKKKFSDKNPFQQNKFLNKGSFKTKNTINTLKTKNLFKAKDKIRASKQSKKI